MMEVTTDVTNVVVVDHKWSIFKLQFVRWFVYIKFRKSPTSRLYTTPYSTRALSLKSTLFFLHLKRRGIIKTV